MSFVLTVGLIFISSQMEPQSPPISTSQVEGLGTPFTAEEEPSYRITAHWWRAHSSCRLSKPRIEHDLSQFA